MGKIESLGGHQVLSPADGLLERGGLNSPPIASLNACNRSILLVTTMHQLNHDLRGNGLLAWALCCGLSASLAAVLSPDVHGAPLEGTAPLEAQGDLAAEMVAGIDRFLLRKTDEALETRAAQWKREVSSPDQYVNSVESNRQHLKRIIGVVDARMPTRVMQPFSAGLVKGKQEDVTAIRWDVLGEGSRAIVHGEGLLVEPQAGSAVATVILLPDADQTPESVLAATNTEPALALRLAASGCRIMVPVLVNREDIYSLVGGERRTNQPHREIVYRGAYEMGRHIIGYEVQKVLALVDWIKQQNPQHPLGVYGYGEGGLIAFYAAAVDPRINACCVSGYFNARQQLWQEPIYRNVWSLLVEFGDAEIATLIAPRPLIIEASRFPAVQGPPKPADGKGGAAPGRLKTPELAAVQEEAARARELVAGLRPEPVIEVIASGDGTGPPGREKTAARLLSLLAPGCELGPAEDAVTLPPMDGEQRQRRQVEELIAHTQHLMREGEYRRREFWSKADASSPDAWQSSMAPYREYFAKEVIGRFDDPRLPPAPRTRQIYDEPAYRGYEVMLDVFPDVFAYGILLVPKGIAPGERRPVVVCQHGLEGRPRDVADPKTDNPAYHQFACRLAERGFVTYAPQNPYIGGDKFRTLQRQANPLGKSLFSIIVPQHQVTVEWLGSLPFVDPQRIAFYGLSYGGKTAMRVPAIVREYCLSICSADFNEWIWKNVSSRSRYSYLGTGEYEMVEFDLGNTFNYAEMAALIAPRPFMVERGHHDGVAPDEWVAYEYAKVRRRYVELKIPERTEIEFFDGPHTIHGVGTFEFLHKHLHWLKPGRISP
jgi:dienelactone hydrolase